MLPSIRLFAFASRFVPGGCGTVFDRDNYRVEASGAISGPSSLTRTWPDQRGPFHATVSYRENAGGSVMEIENGTPTVFGCRGQQIQARFEIGGPLHGEAIELTGAFTLPWKRGGGVRPEGRCR